MGKIISVDPNARTCRAKTVGLPGFTDDLDLTDVRLLHSAWHAQGDEEVFIPRANSYCAILFVGNEPFIVGYVPLQNASGDANPGTDPNLPYNQNLQPGDWRVATAAGNYINVRSGGAIEIVSTLGCRTYYIPTTATIYTLCQNWELDTNGGYLHWDTLANDNTTPPGATLMDFLAWDNITPTKGARIQMGLSETNQLPFELAVGPITANSSIAPSDQSIDEENVLIQMREDGIFQMMTALKTIFAAGPTGEPTTPPYIVQMDYSISQFSLMTPLGHSLVFNDTPDDQSVAITHATGAQFLINTAGAVSLVDSTGNSISLDSQGLHLTTSDGHNAVIGGNTLFGTPSGGGTFGMGTDGSFTASSTVAINMTAPVGSFSTDTTYIGSGAATSGDYAVLYSMLKSIFDNHTHLTAVGPSGPPTPPTTMALMELVPATSAKAATIKLKGNI
jgi:hypothetical protein